MKRRLAMTAAVLACALTALACGGGDEETATGEESVADEGSSSSAEEGSNAVSIEGFEFVPREIEVQPGTTVTWTNQDEAPHSVEDRSDLGTEESEDLAKGDEFSITYEEPGEYPYVCGIHNYMTGTVVVAG